MFVPNFNFVKYFRLATFASGLAMLICLGSMVVQGFNLGIEFTGGVNIEARYPAPPDIEAIRAQLAEGGFDSPIVQSVGGNDVLIRLPPVGEESESGDTEADARDKVLDILGRDVQIRDASTVFPQVGRELTEQGGLALNNENNKQINNHMLRFRWNLSLGAIVATVHDVVITMGVFSLFKLPFDLNVLGSILAVLGYSLNDTIVIYDRIRDNFKLVRRGTPESIVNLSVNQTLARTFVTGVSTLLVLVAMMFLAGDTLWGFAFALIVGIIVGTYSSIYVASAMALWLKIVPADFMPPKQEQVDELP